jgi:hypothetical protein
MNDLLDKNTWKVIRTDGTEEVFPGRAFIRSIEKAIGANCLDSVTLTRHASRAQIVMMVDDTGMIDHKPVNPRATELYLAVCKPGTVYSIHGDVALVWDGDFA